MTSYKNMTVEHLASEACHEDLEQFREFCESYSAQHPGLSDDAVTEAVFGDGDYLANAQRLGLISPSITSVTAVVDQENNAEDFWHEFRLVFAQMDKKMSAEPTDDLICGHQIQHDNSGVGHNWRNISRCDIPSMVIEEIEGEIVDGKTHYCENFVGSDGLHYRWIA